jgi:hypothetical protein
MRDSFGSSSSSKDVKLQQQLLLEIWNMDWTAGRQLSLHLIMVG